MSLNAATAIKYAGILGLFIGAAYQALVLGDYATAGTIATAALAALGFSGKLSVLGKNQAELATQIDGVHAAVHSIPPPVVVVPLTDAEKDVRIAALEAKVREMGG